YNVANDVIGVWKVISGGTDTATFAVDGTTVDTWSDGAAGTISTLPGSTSMWWGNRYAISSTPATHVYTITVTSGNFVVAFFASPQPTSGWLGLTYPRMYFARQPETVNATIDGLIVSDVSQLSTDGWNVAAVNLDNNVPDVSLGASSLIYLGGAYPNGRICPGSVVGFPHPGNCGHTFWSWAYLSAAGKTPDGSGVISYNGRVGKVVPQTGDYTAAQVTNAASTAAANTFTGGLQTILAPTYTSIAEVVRGVTSAGAPIAYVENQTSGSFFPTWTTTTNLTAGTTIIVGIYGDSNAEAAITDSQGNRFTLIGYNSNRATFYIATDVVGGADTLTPVVSGADTYKINLIEFTSSIVDGSINWGTGSSSAYPYTSVPVSLSVANGMVVSGICDTEGSQSASGFTLWFEQQLDGACNTVAYKQESTPGSYSAVWTSTGGDGLTWPFSLGLIPGAGTPQTANLVQNEFNNATVLSGINPAGLPFLTPLTYAALTRYTTCGSSTEGTEGYITDSNVAINSPGTTVAGSGSYHTPVVCQYNGTSYVWVVQ